MRTTANVVSHVDVEQSIRPIRLGVEREPTLVGVGVDLTLDRRGLRRLSHLLSLFLSLYYLYRHYTYPYLSLQEKNSDFCVKRF